jgi:hypothetical protein
MISGVVVDEGVVLFFKRVKTKEATLTECNGMAHRGTRGICEAPGGLGPSVTQSGKGHGGKAVLSTVNESHHTVRLTPEGRDDD